MNVFSSPSPLRWLVLVCIGVCCLLFLTSALFAAEGTAPLQANVIMELVSNRSRLLQVSLVCVALGCALLWWRR
jgi:hypothetical protein